MSGDVLAETAVAAAHRFRLELTLPGEGAMLDTVHGFVFARSPVWIHGGTLEVALPVAVGARVVGTVEGLASSDDLRISRARVELWPACGAGGDGTDAAEPRVAPVGERGEFVLERIPPNRRFDLVVIHPATTPLQVLGLEFEPYEERRLSLWLEQEHLVAVHVVDEGDAPVGGAAVVLTSDSGGPISQGRPYVESSTDARGLAELGALAPGIYRGTVRAEGFRSAGFGPVRSTRRNELQTATVMMSRGSRIAGTVALPDGAPAAGCEVIVTSSSSRQGQIVHNRIVRGSSITNELGEFSVHGLEEGAFDLEFALERTHALLAERVIAPSTGLRFTLQPAHGLAGRVLGPHDRPVESFDLIVSSKLEAPGLGFPVRGRSFAQAISDPMGRFRVDGLLPGTWIVDVRSGAAPPAHGIHCTVPMEEDLVIRLEGGATVSGIVVDPAGRPLPGAVVHVETRDWGLFSQPELLEHVNVAAPTDPAGRFRVQGVKPGPIAAWAEHPDFADSQPSLVNLVDGEERVLGDLRMLEPSSIRGTVFHANAPASAGWLVQASQWTDVVRVLETRTSASGEFRFDSLVPGTWSLAAPALPTESDAHRTLTRQVEVEEGEVVSIELGTQWSDPVRVRGSVSPPAPGVELVFKPTSNLETPEESCLANDESEYEIRLGAPGAYVVTLRAEGLPVWSVERRFAAFIPPVESYELDFRLPGGSILGRAVNAYDDPLEGAVVTITQVEAAGVSKLLSAASASTLTDSEGRFRFSGLPDGTFDLVGRYGRSTDARDFDRAYAPAVRVAGSASSRDVILRFENGSPIEVTVRDESGSPLPRAAVFVRSSGGALIGEGSLNLTDSDGGYLSERLSAGIYFVSARKDELATEEVEIMTSDREDPVACTLVARRGGYLTVRCLVAGRADGFDPNIQLRNGEGRTMGIRTGASTFGDSYERRFGPLPAGNYTVEFLRPTGELGTLAVELDAFGDSVVEVVLGR